MQLNQSHTGWQSNVEDYNDINGLQVHKPANPLHADYSLVESRYVLPLKVSQSRTGQNV